MRLSCSFAVNLDEVHSAVQCTDINLFPVLNIQNMLTDRVEDGYIKDRTCIAYTEIIIGRIRVDLNTGVFDSFDHIR